VFLQRLLIDKRDHDTTKTKKRRQRPERVETKENRKKKRAEESATEVKDMAKKLDKVQRKNSELVKKYLRMLRSLLEYQNGLRMSESHWGVQLK